MVVYALMICDGDTWKLVDLARTMAKFNADTLVLIVGIAPYVLCFITTWIGWTKPRNLYYNLAATILIVAVPIFNLLIVQLFGEDKVIGAGLAMFASLVIQFVLILILWLVLFLIQYRMRCCVVGKT